MDARERQVAAGHERFVRRWFDKKLPEALAAAQDEITLVRHHGGPHHPAMVRALLDLAMAQDATGQGDAAKTLADAQRLLADLEERVQDGPDSLETAEIEQFLADRLADVRGDDDQAVVSGYRRALEIRERLLGPTHPAVADTLARVAQVDYIAGRFAEAEPLYRRAHDIFSTVNDRRQPFWFISSQALADTLMSLERPQEARAFFETALALGREQQTDSRQLYAVLVGFARCLEITGHAAQAAAFKTEASALLPQTNPGEFGYRL